MLRTNYYAARPPKPYCASSSTRTQIPLLPLPRPQFEIFVHSPRVGGRAPARRAGRARRPALVGPARGLPHRDPRPDEGADGQERADRAGRREGRLRGQAPPATHGRRRCYTTFIGALLDITDNIVGGDVVPPAHVVRHDGDDPYLVVAADKGTATFSDIANGVASRVRLLARRRVRVRRVGRLRPQGDGHHRARRVGVRAAPLPRARASTSRARTSPSSASAT